MEFTQLEVQDIINACFCMQGEILEKYVEGNDYVEKSKTIIKLVSRIKKEKGEVSIDDIYQHIMK